jgi:autotransporter translocation and assembly factor TamB
MTRKGTRLIVIVAVALLVLVAATAFFINLYRDSIALEVARSALRDSDIQVSDVSVESISSNEVRFDAIVLELAAGGTVFIEGITLPIRVRGLRDSALHVDTLTFVPGTMDTGPTRFAAGLQSFLDAPAATPGATIRIGEVLLPDLPVVRTWPGTRTR